jgi:hypothetical protein
VSFSISFPRTARTDFAAAVDAATESPVQLTDAGKGAVASVKAAAKLLADRFDGAYPIAGYGSGHICQESPGSSPYDTTAVSVSEVE